MFNINDFVLLASIAGVGLIVFLAALALKKAYQCAFSRVVIVPAAITTTSQSSITRVAITASSNPIKKVVFTPRLTELDPFLFKSGIDLDDTNEDLMLYASGITNTSFMVFDN